MLDTYKSITSSITLVYAMEGINLFIYRSNDAITCAHNEANSEG